MKKTAEEYAFEAMEKNLAKPVQYQYSYSNWMDWYRMGFEKATSIFKSQNLETSEHKQQTHEIVEHSDPFKSFEERYGLYLEDDGDYHFSIEELNYECYKLDDCVKCLGEANWAMQLPYKNLVYNLHEWYLKGCCVDSRNEPVCRRMIIQKKRTNKYFRISDIIQSRSDFDEFEEKVTVIITPLRGKRTRYPIILDHKKLKQYTIVKAGIPEIDDDGLPF